MAKAYNSLPINGIRTDIIHTDRHDSHGSIGRAEFHLLLIGKKGISIKNKLTKGFSVPRRNLLETFAVDTVRPPVFP